MCDVKPKPWGRVGGRTPGRPASGFRSREEQSRFDKAVASAAAKLACPNTRGKKQKPKPCERKPKPGSAPPKGQSQRGAKGGQDAAKKGKLAAPSGEDAFRDGIIGAIAKGEPWVPGFYKPPSGTTDVDATTGLPVERVCYGKALFTAGWTADFTCTLTAGTPLIFWLPLNDRSRPVRYLALTEAQAANIDAVATSSAGTIAWEVDPWGPLSPAFTDGLSTNVVTFVTEALMQVTVDPTSEQRVSMKTTSEVVGPMSDTNATLKIMTASRSGTAAVAAGTTAEWVRLSDGKNPALGKFTEARVPMIVVELTGASTSTAPCTVKFTVHAWSIDLLDQCAALPHVNLRPYANPPMLNRLSSYGGIGRSLKAAHLESREQAVRGAISDHPVLGKLESGLSAGGAVVGAYQVAKAVKSAGLLSRVGAAVRGAGTALSAAEQLMVRAAPRLLIAASTM